MEEDDVTDGIGMAASGEDLAPSRSTNSPFPVNKQPAQVQLVFHLNGYHDEGNTISIKRVTISCQ